MKITHLQDFQVIQWMLWKMAKMLGNSGMAHSTHFFRRIWRNWTYWTLRSWRIPLVPFLSCIWAWYPRLLLEGKMEWLLSAIDRVWAAISIPLNLPRLLSSNKLAQGTTVKPPQEGLEELLDLGLNIKSTNCSNSTLEPIDIDSLSDNTTPMPNLKKSAADSCTKVKPQIQPCSRIAITLPPRKSMHTLYPFALHKSLGDLWDYSVSAGKFVLHLRGCSLHLDNMQSQTNQCPLCTILSKNTNIIGIMNQMKDGVHISAPFHYHGVGGLITVLYEKARNVQALHFWGLNNAKKLVIKVRTLEVHKKFIMEIRSSKVEHIEQLIKIVGFENVSSFWTRLCSNFIAHVTIQKRMNSMAFSSGILEIGKWQILPVKHLASYLLGPSIAEPSYHSSLPLLDTQHWKRLSQIPWPVHQSSKVCWK